MKWLSIGRRKCSIVLIFIYCSQMEHFYGCVNILIPGKTSFLCRQRSEIIIFEMKKFYLTVALFSVIVLAGCQSKSNQVAEVPPVKVRIMQVSTETDITSGHFSGTVEEGNGTYLSFPVMGTVRTLHFHLGQQVSKGQLLATLDPTSMQSSYNAARASLEQAEDAYRRMKELHDKGSLPEIQWVEVQSKLQQARSLEEIAGKNLKDCKLYAPFGGVIAEKTVEIGQNVAPGGAVAKLVTAGTLKVKIAVPEAEIAGISLSQKARITVQALNGKTFSGTVIEKGIVANPLSRSYEVKIRVENEGKDLMPGMVAEVALEHKADSAGDVRCVIPASIVQLDEKNNYFVWVEKDGKASKQVIGCGEFTASGVTVLSGLQEGTRVIVEGQHKVCEGTELDVF